MKLENVKVYDLEETLIAMDKYELEPEMEKLKAVFPQCFAEGKLDIDKLLSLCGEYIDNDFEKYKFEWKGKIEIISRCEVSNRDQLSHAYTPGVAQPCLEIEKNPDLSYDLTRRANLVAVITDGTAVLGLGDIGPRASMPVMEGKAVLFKEFGGVNAVPICLDTQDTEEIIKAVTWLAPGYGGVNLEDISAPRCFEIEERLKETLNIPVFHDDQHGTAIVVLAALINSLKVTDSSRATPSP